MTTAYTSLLGFALPVTGELSGTWGDTVNNGITSLLDSAIAGTTTLSADSDVTLTTTQGSSNTAREAILLWTAGGSATRTITAPAQSKIYTVINASSGTQSIILAGVGPTTGVTIAKGESALVAWNGSDFIKISNTAGPGTFTNLTVTGNTSLGDADTDTITQAASYVTGTQLKSAKTATNTLALAAYDVDGTAYTNLITLTAANAPTLALTSTGVGTINNMSIGATTASTGAFTTLSASGAVTLSGGTEYGVAYLNGAKVLTTGSALVFDGTNFSTTGSNTKLTNNTSADVTVQIGPDIPNATRSGRIGFINSSTEKNWYIANNWNVGGALEFTQTTAAGGSTLSGSPAMLLDRSGNLGIGTTLPAYKLDLLTSTNGIVARFKSSSNYGTVVADNSTSTGGGSFSARQNGTQYGAFAVDGAIQGNTSTDVAIFADTGSSLKFYTNGSGTVKASISTAGLFTVAAGASIQTLTVGLGAGAVSTNTAVGASALAANTTGDNNTAVGWSAGYSNVTGTSNTYIGRAAGYQSTASNNTAVGATAFTDNTSGANNVAVGTEALNKNTTASNNTAVGYKALYANTTGNAVNAVGANALESNTTGGFNAAFGNASLQTNSTGSYNTAIGVLALQANTASYNTAVGYQAAYLSKAATGLTALGHQALYNNTTGANNVALGGGVPSIEYSALQSNTTGSSNTAVGVAALGQNTTASYNTAVGYMAGYSNLTGDSLVAVGANALKSNTTGFYNTAIGVAALYSNFTGSYNTAVGRESLSSNTIASNNTAVGFQAGYSNTTSSSQTFVGYQAGYNTTGQGNTFVGKEAGLGNTIGQANTYIGNNSGVSMTTGSKNTILGIYSGNQGGLDIRTASNNIVLSDGDGNPNLSCNSSKQWSFLGNSVNSSSRGGNSVVNLNSGATAYDANFHITDAVANNAWFGLLNGNAYVMTNTLGVNLSSGATAWASASDSRLKNVTGTYLTALSDIAQIDVVKFTWKSDKKAKPCVGVIAQSVQGVVPEAMDEFTENDEQYLSVRYTELIPLMIASIQELKAEVDSLKSQLNQGA